MQVTVDERSGFCFGVVNAIKKAEEELEKSGSLYCLGNIVHNNAEVDRLKQKGLITINYEQFQQLNNCKVLIRAHGEPPSTYETARQNNIELIDASCPVVLKLQQRVKKSHTELQAGQGQVVIFGKHGHAEVNGLVGQTDDKALVVHKADDLHKIDFTKPVTLYSQTTMDLDEFAILADAIRHRMREALKTETIPFKIHDTICRQVANRVPQLKEFSARHDVILFASGKDSSNGKVLYEVCKSINANTYFITRANEIDNQWFANKQSVGICGATSTPKWLMDEIAEYVKGV